MINLKGASRLIENGSSSSSSSEGEEEEKEGQRYIFV
jgi:hypothetical protein